MIDYQPYPIKIKATNFQGVTEIIIQLFHHMQSGLQHDLRGNLIQQHYIHEVKIYHQQKELINAQLNYTISANPRWKFSFKGGKLGDLIKVIWYDNLGYRRSDSTTII